MTQPKLTQQTRDRRTVKRYYRAWERFAIGGECPFCVHGFGAHALGVGQPHFYRPATEVDMEPLARVVNLLMLRDEAGADAELASIPRTLCLMYWEDGTPVVARRITVTKNAEVQAAWCLTCAETKNTNVAVCYQATEAIGELLGTPPATPADHDAIVRAVERLWTEDEGETAE